MKLLTAENIPFELNCIPDQVNSVDECVRYCVLDCSDKNYIDYFFVPLIFLESFYAPTIVLDINGKKIQMPLDWSILVCDEHFNDIEIVPLTELNDRGFKTPIYNPLTTMIPEAVDVEIVDVYTSVKWFLPRLKSGHILPVPVSDGENPLCCYFIKDTNNLVSPIDPAELFS